MTSSRSTTISRRHLLRGSLLTAAAVPFGMSLAACDTGGTGGEAGGGGGEAIDLTDKMEGAMEDFGVGTTFVATAPVTFGMLYRDHPNYPYQSDWSFMTHVRDTNNVSFDFVNVPLSDFDQRRNLLLAAGDAPALIPSAYIGTMDQFVPSGTVVPISQYLDYLPNFQQKVQDWGLTEDLDRTRQLDGEFYVLPGLLEAPKPQYSIGIRKDLWEEAGLDLNPATWDEFAEQLQVIQDTFPELDYAYSERWSTNAPLEGLLQSLSGGFGTEAGWSFADGVIWDGSQFVYVGGTESYRTMLEYVNGLIEAGVMDPESLTQSDEAAEQKFAAGKSAAMGINDQGVPQYQTLLDEAGTDGEVHQIIVPAGPMGFMVEGGSGTNRFESGVAFSSAALESANFVAMLQFVDWLYYSDEGLEFARWGVEGETFTRGEDGKRTLMDDINTQGLNPSGTQDLQADYGYCNGVFMPAHGSTQDLVDSMSRPEVVEWRAAMNEREMADPGPAYKFDELAQESAALQQSALQDLVMQNTAAFILGQRSFDEWDAFVGELESAGMSTYVQAVNDAIQE
jgi:putative aldouronate transport system substrate-binding protein